MKFLKNAWYCAAWTHEVGQDLMSRKILNQSVLLYRKQSGEAVAIGNRCPHRFAPLADGKRIGDTVQCPYHGLVFDETGACVHNPHGAGAIPRTAKVNVYPLIERDGVAWIWMGDSLIADPATIPDFSEVAPRPGWATVYGKLHVPAYYELISDNLLDLSHVQYLHPFLTPNDPPPEQTESRTMDQDGDTVWSRIHRSRTSPSPLHRLLLAQDGEPPAECDTWADMRWSAPSNLLLDTGMTSVGGAHEDGLNIPSAHLLTPETETTTHYFWALARNKRIDEAEIGEAVGKGIQGAFQFEDEPMIVSCYELMDHENDLMSLKPVILPGDAAAVRARLILNGRIKSQAA